MTERTKTIKGLISGHVDMGTFGLVELELLAIEKEYEALSKHAVSGQSEQLKAFQGWQLDKGYLDQKKIKNGMVDEYLKSL
jgi:dihydropteroate synthase